MLPRLCPTSGLRLGRLTSIARHLEISMPKVNTFSASKWIANNTSGGTELSAVTQRSLADFTIMWNFFESTLCNNRASVNEFKRIIANFQPAQLDQMTIQKLNSCLSYWRTRYCISDGFNQLFNELNFRLNDCKTDVKEVLNETKIDLRDKIFALMILIYRLRNNLFHGLKSIQILNNQVDNINNASFCIAAILESIPSILVQPPQTTAANW